jgi:dUTP pyrophosphatase
MIFKKKKPAPIEVRVRKLAPDAVLPSRPFTTDAGLDLSSVEDIVLAPGEHQFVHTGVSVVVPVGYVGLICGRSSMNRANINCQIGVVDSGYTGEVSVGLINNTPKMIRIKPKHRIAQIVLLPIPELKTVEVVTKERTPRGDKGFGSSGT